MVDEVELLEANPQYAHIRKPDGTETTVSLKHLAPKGNDSNANQPHVNVPSDVISKSEVCDTQSLESVISPTPEQSVQQSEYVHIKSASSASFNSCQ